jgi:hypothetical protein
MPNYRRDALNAVLKDIRAERGLLPRQQEIWQARSRNVLDDDLGIFDDSGEADYCLEDATRDRLIVHTRQDVAMAYFALIDAEREAKNARIWSWASFLVSLVILYKVW